MRCDGRIQDKMPEGADLRNIIILYSMPLSNIQRHSKVFTHSILTLFSLVCQTETKTKTKTKNSPSQCGSSWLAVLCKLKSLQFDSQSGYLPGWQVLSLVGAQPRRQPVDISHINVSLPHLLPPFPSL